MRLPTTVEEAMVEAEREAAWMRRRFPDMLSWVNASYSGSLDFWKWVLTTSVHISDSRLIISWPQAADDLLEDMQLPIHRSNGNWFTWPFKVVELNEIASLADERRQKRSDIYQ